MPAFDNRNRFSSASFKEGDIFYVESKNGYDLFKVLKVDDAMNTYHLLMYEPVSELPGKENVKELDILMYHAPIDKDGFERPVHLAESTLTYRELSGYYEYLKQNSYFEELASVANNYFDKAYQLTDLGKHQEAIENYTYAIQLIPVFYEAIDNRGLSKMDLALWHDAIDDFQLSLTVNPDGFLAVFSIGECLFNLGDFHTALAQFEQAMRIDPSSELPAAFIRKITDMN